MSVRAPYRRRSRSWLAAFLVVIAAAAAPRGAGQAQAPSFAAPDAFPNYDIRYPDPGAAKDPSAAAYLDAVGPAAGRAADALSAHADARATLRSEAAGAIVQSDVLDGLTVVSAMPGTAMLSASAGSNEATLRAFLGRHAAAYGLAPAQVADLAVVADYANPAGNLSWVDLEQRFHGIPVFQGQVRGAFTAKGDLARTNGLLATGIDGATLTTTPLLTETQAIALAAGRVGLSAPEKDANAWLVYFPLAPGVVRLAWATQVFGDPLAFLTVVDAQTGTMLFRKNLTAFQTQTATYHVYTGDSPAPSSPTTALPGMNFQPPLVPRVPVTRIGNEAPYAFNNLGWMTDGTNTTDGNNVQAGIDRDGTNGVDATINGTSRVFNFAYNPSPGSPGPGDDPLLAAYQAGEVTNMFYWVNRYHDETYLYGFTEAALNFQNDNFGRGGVGADRISAETQDSSGTNNANFATPADGTRPRMQMYLWTGPTPDRSGGLDREVMVHELTHGLSNRLHTNGSGLGSNMSGGLGEGWSDFFAKALFATSAEPADGIYSMGGYATDEISPGYENYYYGIRRFPMAIISNHGANGRPHNPLTFADIDSTQANLTDGAYPAGSIGVAQRDQVHEAGQIWANMLWEVRARVIARLGFAVGNQRVIQWVTDGMKADPINPTFISARDSILAAATAGGATTADIADIWAGFAARGLGTLAAVTVNGTGANNTRVSESFLRPGDPTPTFTINDVTATEGNAGTKTFAFTVTLANPTPATATVAYATANGTASSSLVETTFTNSTALTIPDSGASVPYGTSVTVSGLSGTLGSVAVRLNGLTHTFPDDLDLLLVAPNGAKMILQSDVGSSGDVSGLTYTISDAGSGPLSSTQLTAGTFTPTDTATGDTFTAPAPAGPYADPAPAGAATMNGTFGGINPNGTWTLYVVDDASGDSGSLSGGFSLIVGIPNPSADYTPASGTLTFPAGVTTQTVNVTVNGDTTPEPSETFFVNLTNPLSAVIGDAQGVGLITNDDGTPPTATADAYSTPFATPLSVAAPGVLANDTSNGGGALSAILVSSPANGLIALAADGGFSYTPNSGFAGADSFTYRAQSAISLNSAVVTVTLTVNAPTTPQPPVAFYVASVVGNHVRLRWTAPAVGPAPTGYLIEGGVAPGDVLASLPLGPVPVFEFDAPSGAFFVRARTVTAVGVSPNSNEVPLVVNVPVAPSAPEGLLGLAAGPNLSLSWHNTFGGGAATGSVLDVSGPVSASLPLGLAESFSFAGVPAGTYTFQVRSVNAGGTSAPSNAVSLSFPGGCAGAPLPPTRFLAYAAGSTLNLLWEPPATGAALSGYVLSATGTVTASVPMSTTSLSVPVPPGTYNLSVQAANACGVSAPTAVQTVVIP